MKRSVVAVAKFPDWLPGRGWTFGLLLVAVTLLAYLPGLTGQFVWDDDAWTSNASGLLSDVSGLRRMWTRVTALQQYYPLTGTTFWVDYQLWGGWTLPYHVENVLLHACAAILCWRLLRRLGATGAWLAGAVFALHPMMVESAGWITERKNVLSLCFYVGALLAYGRFAGYWKQENESGGVGHGGRCRGGWAYALALLLFVGAELAKATAFSLPAAILLLGWWKRGRIRWREEVVPCLPFFAVTIGFGLLTVWLESGHVGARGPEWTFSALERCLIAGRAFWFYIGKLLWPAKLCFLYVRWQPDTGSLWQWLYPVAAAGLLIGLWAGRRRLGRGPAAAVYFYTGTLLPVLGFMNAYGMRFSFVWDHWAYLSSVGIIALVAAMAVRGADSLPVPGLRLAAAVLLLSTLGVLTWEQSKIYADPDTLWRKTLIRNPKAFLADNNLGLSMLGRGQVVEAIAHFERALSNQPTFAEAHNSLGSALAAAGRLHEAVGCYRRALQLKPDYVAAHNNLGDALAKEGKLDEAIEHYREALRQRPDYAPARNNLGAALAREGKLDEAIAQYAQALQLNPAFAEAYNNLGLALADQGKLTEAIQQYEKALQYRPDHAEAHDTLAGVFLRVGRVEEALTHYRAAVSAQPTNAYFLNNLAWVLATCPDPAFRNGAEAVQLAEKACQSFHPPPAALLATLAAAYAETGRFDDAVRTARQALDVADKAGERDSAAKQRQRLLLYESHQPYRESN